MKNPEITIGVNVEIDEESLAKATAKIAALKAEEPKTVVDAEQIMLKQLELLQKTSNTAEDHYLSGLSHAMAAVYTAIK